MDDIVKRIGFVDLSVREEELWFPNVYNSTLLKMDKNSGKVILKSFLPAMSLTGKLQYGPIVCKDENLIMAPQNGRNILVYNVKENSVVKIPLGHCEKNGRVSMSFKSAIIYRDDVFFFPGRYPAIVKLNLHTYKLTYFDGWHDEIKKYMPNMKSVVCNCAPVCMEDYCYFPLYQRDGIVKFQFDSGVYEIFWLSDGNSYISSLQCEKSTFWVSYADKPEILQWDSKKKVKKVFNELPSDSKLEMGFTFIYPYENEIIAIPINGNMLLAFNKLTGNARKYTNLNIPMETENKVVIEGLNFTGQKVIGNDELWLYSAYEDIIYRIDLSREEVRKYDAVLSFEEDIYRIKAKILDRYNTFWEKEEMPLQEYLRYIEYRQKNERADVKKKVNEKIWNMLKL